MKPPFSLSLLALGLWAESITTQVFEDLKYPVNHPGMSESCQNALNTTLSKCPSLLGEVAVDNPRLTSEQLSELCTADCQTSLRNAREKITGSCHENDVINLDEVDWPAKVIIDRFLYTYRLSCRKDSETGKFCDEIFVSWLGNPRLTAAQNCSDCMLGMMQTQLNSPFGYDDEFAADFNSTTKSCSASGYTFTSPLPYALNATSTAPPTNVTVSPLCSNPYHVLSSDTCNSISLAHNVSTHALISAGGLSPSCSNLQAVGSICLPASCDLYRVDYDETCEEIIEKHPGLDEVKILNWNPNINMVCANIGAMVDTFICVGPPGGHLSQPPITTTTTTSATPTSVPKPTNAPPESNPRCGKWYVIKEGDFCDKISIRQGISLSDFYFLNPEVNSTCGNLMLGIAYCVQPVGDISTYKGYPTTSEFYTLPPISYSTTTEPTLSPAPPPETTPIIQLPNAPRTLADCKSYVEHVPIPSLQEQAASNHYFAITDSINSCYHVLATYGVSMEHFLIWNPSLASVKPCALQPGYSYCASNGTTFDDEPEPPSKYLCIPVDKSIIPPGSLPSCSCFNTVEGGDRDARPCKAIADDAHVSVDKLMELNPWIGSDCDKSIYAGLDDADERAVCIGAKGGSTSSSSSHGRSSVAATPTSR